MSKAQIQIMSKILDDLCAEYVCTEDDCEDILEPSDGQEKYIDKAYNALMCSKNYLAYFRTCSEEFRSKRLRYWNGNEDLCARQVFLENISELVEHELDECERETMELENHQKCLDELRKNSELKVNKKLKVEPLKRSESIV